MSIAAFRWLPPFAAIAAFGCGGRTADFGTVLDDGGVGASGALGGSNGAGGGAAGRGGHGASSGGYVGTGGRECIENVCPAVQCGPGQQEMTLPGQCCPSCEPCPPQPCPAPYCGPGGQITIEPGQCCPVCTNVNPCGDVICAMCPPGSTPVSLPGQCCPSCSFVAVDASVGSCDQNSYAAFIQKELISLNALSCMIDSDCTVVALVNSCEVDCGRAVNVSSSGALYEAAQKIAATSCNACPPTAGGACPGAYITSCVNGQCQVVMTFPPGSR